MKKIQKNVSFLLVLTILLSLFSLPAVAASTIDESTPWWVAEGETWVPATEIVPFEYGACDRTGHLPPTGYRYQGHTVGNTVVEGFLSEVAVTLTSFVPGIGTITAVIATGLFLDSVLDYFRDGKKVRAEYYKYIYENEDGDIWYHVIWHELESDGNYAYIACEIGTM